MFAILIQAVSAPEARSRLTRLFGRYHAFLLSKAAELTRDPAAAEDVVQEALIHIIRREDTWQGFTPAQLLAYTVRAIHNTAVDYLRREQKTTHWDDIAEVLAGPDFVEHIIEQMDREELYQQLGLALKSLSKRDRAIVIQKYILQHDNEQIAQSLGIKPESVPVTVNRAKKRLADHLDRIREGSV